VEQFARERGLADVPLDNYGFSDATMFVPHSRVWDCQAPEDSDAGHWVVLSANMILDGHNCGWIMQYPHESLARDGMYAIRLPSPIPPAGTPGGPPPVAARRLFLNFPTEMRVMFRRLTNHPDEMQKTMDDMMARFQKAQAEANSKKKR
jgi:hypothetical protein